MKKSCAECHLFPCSGKCSYNPGPKTKRGENTWIVTCEANEPGGGSPLDTEGIQKLAVQAGTKVGALPRTPPPQIIPIGPFGNSFRKVTNSWKPPDLKKF